MKEPEAKIKTGYGKRIENAKLQIDIEKEYEEGYEMMMLRFNDIPGLLRVDGCGVEQSSRYTYHVRGMVSMRSMYRKARIEQRELLGMLRKLESVVQAVHRFMLNENHILLEPDYIFHGEDQFAFCYLPDAKEDFYQEFHKLTEYFVRHIDYEDSEAVYLMQMVNRESMEENYDLGEILMVYETEAAERKAKAEEKALECGNIFEVEDASEWELPEEENMIREEKLFQKAVGKVLSLLTK